METHDHLHITRQQRLKLHAASGVTITCYWLHEQHKCGQQADLALHYVSGALCSLRIPTSARLLIDIISRATQDSWSRSSWTSNSQLMIRASRWAKACARRAERPAHREPLVASPGRLTRSRSGECDYLVAKVWVSDTSAKHTAARDSYPIAIPDRRGAIRCYLSPG